MIPITLDRLENELKRGEVQTVYLLLGPEEYLRNRAVQLLREITLTPELAAFNYSEFIATTASVSEILEAAKTFPVLAARRVILVSDVQLLDAKQHEQLIAYIREPQSRSVLILIADELDRRTRFYASLKQHVCIVEFPKVKGFALEQWAHDFIRSKGLRISTVSVQKLVERAGSDLQTLANEIEKLLLYCYDQKEIPDSAVDDVVGGSRQHGIFELISALGRRDRKKALMLLGNLLETGETPPRVLAMMARHFRQVLIVKELLQQGRNPREIAAAAQIPGFILNDFLQQARGIEESVAREMFVRLAEADYRFRSSGVSKRLIFEHLIYTL